MDVKKCVNNIREILPDYIDQIISYEEEENDDTPVKYYIPKKDFLKYEHKESISEIASRQYEKYALKKKEKRTIREKKERTIKEYTHKESILEIARRQYKK